MRKSRSVRHVHSKAFETHLKYQARKQDNALYQSCVRCPKTVEDGHACCQDCRDKMAQGKRTAVESGLCIDCWTAPVVPGKRRCATHDGLRQRERSTIYMQRLVRRQCVRCGKAPAQRGVALCQTCAVKQQAYEQKKRQALHED